MGMAFVTTWTTAWGHACGLCNGPGDIYECGCADVPEGDCDCEGNQLDALGVCGGTCAEDVDADGICDDVDDCIGVVDECGVCNGRRRHLRVWMCRHPGGRLRLQRQPVGRHWGVWW